MYCKFSLTQVTLFSSLRFVSANSAPDLTYLCSKGRIKEAFERFNHHIWADPSLFSHFIQSCISKNSISLAKQLHSLIIASGCSSDKFTCNNLLNMYSKLGHLQTSVALYGVMPRKNVMSCNILINAFFKTEDLVGARKLFDEMSERKVTTYNAMVTGLIQLECNEDGLGLFSEMIGLGFLPDEYTVGSVLKGCAGLRDLCRGQQVHGYVTKCGYGFDLIVGSSLAHMYMKSGKLEQGENVILAMEIRNVVAWNTLIAGNAQHGYSENVLNQYRMMKLTGSSPDKITFVSVISSCSDLATLGQGLQIHAETIKVGASSDVSVITSLVSMYSRCGCLEDSIKSFLECDGEDVVLWSSMIAAYGFHGRGEEAVQLFNQMEQGNMEANTVTFLSLLYACSHSGLKGKGLEVFDLMVEKYGLKPSLKHYTCVVDLLGRSGCLEEAEAMIRAMPVKADTIIWKTLLSACKTHKNADMAKRIGKEVLRVDPHDSASYILLSNIHASVKRWQDVSEVRRAMRENSIKKEPGISWFELKNHVHQFCMGEKSHPKSEEIGLYLKELTLELQLKGYVPDTASVLHDMDNEEKEYSLAHHSERLAIGFALMNTPEGVPIRIMKNLRVCSDCHVAIKYISEIKNREIVVRDASRFHHFKDGECSCGDYW